jgi:hypothetical protein
MVLIIEFLPRDFRVAGFADGEDEGFDSMAR